jgi:hypothetical protein
MMAYLLGYHEFLNDIQQQGMGKWLFEDGQQRPGFDTKIAADESRTLSPLNGLRTSPEIAEAFQAFNQQVQRGAFADAWMKFVGVAKGAKTVGSLMTQTRNLMGQPFFMAMNGHFDPRPAFDAVRATAADVGLTGDVKWRDYYKKMLDLGIVDQSAKASELRDALKDAGLNDIGLDEFGGGVGLQNLRKATLGTAERAYQVSDDIGKIIGFENEAARLKKINPSWTEEQTAKEAARRIQMTYPTYSRVPVIVKDYIKQQPFLGPFVSFGSEMFRTTANALKLTAEDLRSTNLEQRKAGAQRLAGQMLVLGGAGYGASAVSRGLNNVTQAEQDDARRFLPEWDKNSQLIITGAENGKLSYVNGSYVNPYSGITDPINRFIDGQRDDESILKSSAGALAETLAPFTGEDIMASALFDIARNQTATGRQIWNPQDDFDTKRLKIQGRIYEALEPGTLTRLRKKIIPAFQGQTTSTGQALSPAQEIGSELTGFKQQTLDYRQALGFKGSRFNNSSNDAEGIFREVALRRGNVDPADIKEAYDRSENVRYGIWSELYRDALAAQRRGVGASEVKKILESRNVPKKEASAIIRGEYIPYVPAPKTVKQTGRTLPQLTSPKAGQRLE